MAVPAKYIFLPWVRQGAASIIQTADPLEGRPIKPGVASLSVKLSVNDEEEVEREVRLYGPGDVKSIDAQQVVRTDPRHLATDFEPNYFPAIEFDRPEFPWLFTPAKSGRNECLRPWLCLVVVRKREGVELRTDPKLPLLVLEVDEPDSELPDLSESWAWAHVQVMGSEADTDSLQQSLAGDPALTVSRLLCPRRLDPLTSYLACVVPAFELGRLAGLGQTIAEGDKEALEPAWKAGVAHVSLPVYYHWEFRTGVGDDFESLAAEIEPRKMPAEVGKRPLDISGPGFKITPPPATTTLELEGALRVRGAKPVPWDPESREAFQTELKKILDAPSLAASAGAIEPLLAPPIYGEWYAARHTVNLSHPPPGIPPWLDELNLDPRHRGTAALGTQVVQSQQEQLMASAWEQLGEIERINQILRQAQLARAVAGTYHARHFGRFSAETLLKVVAPAQSRVVIDDVVSDGPARTSLSRKIERSPIPSKAVSAPLRRLARPRGAIATRFRETVQATNILGMMNFNTMVPLERTVQGLVTLNKVSAQVSGLAQSVTFQRSDINNAPPHNNFRIFPEGEHTPPQRGGPGQVDSAEIKIFRNAVVAEQEYGRNTFSTIMIFPAPPVDLGDTKSKLSESIDPERTIPARVHASLTIRGGTPQRADALEPFMDSPVFPQPMYEGLRDLSQDFLFPGLEHVLPKSVTLLETNPKFVEAFMVGLNAEMGRELLWRKYPTDQRGTYFRRFWDNVDDDADPDIGEITGWGENALGASALLRGNLVLLIRGELLRRYPNTVVYAVRARKIGQQLRIHPDAAEIHPLFRGTLKPDVTFLGFNLTEPQALEGDGFFFVIQEQPTEPRFGLDKADFTKDPPELTTWNNLSWRHFAENEEKLKALSHAPAGARLVDSTRGEWGRNSAHQAYITLQRPVRVAIHAKDMLQKPQN